MQKTFIPYIAAFVITASIFLSAFYVSDRLLNTRLQQLNLLQQKISLNILSVETRFALLKQASCRAIKEGGGEEIGITGELNKIARRIKLFESQLDPQDEQLHMLRKKYALLQIKDFLLVRTLAQKCDYNIATVLYFYTKSCDQCRRQSVVLDAVKNKYPYVRVYWIDESLPDPAIKTLLQLFRVRHFPAIVIGGMVHEGFVDYDTVAQEVVEWAKMHEALQGTTTPSTTPHRLP